MIDEKKYDILNKVLDGEYLEQIDKSLEEEVERYRTYIKAYFLSQESYAVINRCKHTIISKIIINLDMEE
ncbi:hypothetical protein SAMN02745164_01560 [Marinitoga hydrogenitolerans DSM 16785]|uniref:Uncharacterized protein n=1 Tax=Marinitoga hydrogenitolerans (strain DSM 16785 / JCM 12826 / AT1271) TaxID=1122195 RepID=A0A1M4Y015_MARH1|nr:hypothetical protein [Marinitoga hydrogenitolerans]SHE99020.1 hypothetical protein SAMN02745164_01560 [Marinitoga hydrogenitolerans DSM 16785]